MINEKRISKIQPRPSLRGCLVVSAVITAAAAVIPAVVSAAVLPGVRGRTIAVPAAGSTAAAAAAILPAVTLETVVPLISGSVPSLHFLPLLAAGGLPASTTAVAAAVTGASAAVAAAAPPHSSRWNPGCRSHCSCSMFAPCSMSVYFFMGLSSFLQRISVSCVYSSINRRLV